MNSDVSLGIITERIWLVVIGWGLVVDWVAKTFFSCNLQVTTLNSITKLYNSRVTTGWAQEPVGAVRGSSMHVL